MLLLTCLIPLSSFSRDHDSLEGRSRCVFVSVAFELCTPQPLTPCQWPLSPVLLLITGGTGELVMAQVLQGMGGGFAAIIIQTAAQSRVAHVDVAIVTALVLLITEVGNSVGSAIATAAWTGSMPNQLARYVPTDNTTLLDELYGSIYVIASYPAGDPIREGAIQAYGHVMKVRSDLMHASVRVRLLIQPCRLSSRTSALAPLSSRSCLRLSPTSSSTTLSSMTARTRSTTAAWTASAARPTRRWSRLTPSTRRPRAFANSSTFNHSTDALALQSSG